MPINKGKMCDEKSPGKASQIPKPDHQTNATPTRFNGRKNLRAGDYEMPKPDTQSRILHDHRRGP